ncbi:MAG: hypothetical protein PHW04_12475 [Candidatus Wallbacteria bacterium]|nr:hypothetical protein [Candidatus Wallbacteria bacterium]
MNTYQKQIVHRMAAIFLVTAELIFFILLLDFMKNGTLGAFFGDYTPQSQTSESAPIKKSYSVCQREASEAVERNQLIFNCMNRTADDSYLIWSVFDNHIDKKYAEEALPLLHRIAELLPHEDRDFEILLSDHKPVLISGNADSSIQMFNFINTLVNADKFLFVNGEMEKGYELLRKLLLIGLASQRGTNSEGFYGFTISDGDYILGQTFYVLNDLLKNPDLSASSRMLTQILGLLDKYHLSLSQEMKLLEDLTLGSLENLSGNFSVRMHVWDAVYNPGTKTTTRVKECFGSLIRALDNDPTADPAPLCQKLADTRNLLVKMAFNDPTFAREQNFEIRAIREIIRMALSGNPVADPGLPGQNLLVRCVEWDSNEIMIYSRGLEGKDYAGNVKNIGLRFRRDFLSEKILSLAVK